MMSSHMMDTPAGSTAVVVLDGQSLPVADVVRAAEAVLDDTLADRPPTDDVTRAAALLDQFTQLTTDEKTRWIA